MTVAAAYSLVIPMLAGCNQSIPGETREPRCEPRSMAEPGRLSIDTDAEDFAVSDPCRLSLNFYMARNTPLRELEAEIGLFDGDSNAVASRALSVHFGEADYGMLSREFELEPVHGRICRALTANLSGLACRDDQGRSIECPKIRLKTSYVLEDFTIETDGLDVCFD